MRAELNRLDARLFLELYTSVGWEPPCVEQVEKALQNSVAAFAALENDEAVGMVRLIGECGMSF